MSRPLSNFDLMWSAYPSPGGTATQAKAAIGGQANHAWIDNTCVLRISRCFNYAGHPIPNGFPGLATVTGADGMRYAFRVAEFHRYLDRIYGAPTLTNDDAIPPGRPIDDVRHAVPAAFRGRQGLIAFVVPEFSDATGHIDLWNGAECVNHGYFAEATEIALWEIPNLAGGGGRVTRGLPSLDLDASVGEGGANRPADVVCVQTLLVERGAQLVIDGRCGSQTIEAIRRFQTKFGDPPVEGTPQGRVSAVDGRIDPGGRTWRKLNGL